MTLQEFSSMLDHWTATADGRVIDRNGATVCLCHQLPLDDVPADTKAAFIAKACNQHARLVSEHAALLDLLKRINTAFYVEGTTKALRPVMSETKPLIRRAEGRE